MKGKEHGHGFGGLGPGKYPPGPRVEDLIDASITPASGEGGKAFVFDWNSGNYRYILSTVSAGGSNSFETVSCPNGTNPVADSTTDTLSLSGLGIKITGNASSDAVFFQPDISALGADVAPQAADLLMTYDTSASDHKQITISALPFASSSHTHAAGDVTSGTFDDARIAVSNVTQHADEINLLDLKDVSGSLATGDVLYRTAGGAWSPLAIGTAGKILTVASGLPSWESASGGDTWKVIDPSTGDTLTASGEDTLNVTAGTGISVTGTTPDTLTIANTITTLDDMTIGTPTDTSWADGIFSSWSSATNAADALDEISETMSYLAPADASSLDGGTLAASGTTKYTGYLSAGAAVYNFGEGAGTSVSYIISDATFSLVSPSTSTTFNKADEGTLKYNLNGALNDSYDMAAAFNESNRAGSQVYPPATGAAGNLRVDSVGWYNSFPKWQKGNATILVVPGDLLDGYNYFTMVHDLDTDQTSATYQVFYDNASPSRAISTPTISENTPAWKYLSGVKMYDNGSTWNLSTALTDCFKNVYKRPPCTLAGTVTISPSSIDINDASVSGVSSPPNRTDTMTVTNRVVTAAAASTRSTNLRFTATHASPYTSNAASSTSASANRLYDSYGTTSTAIYEYFDDENRRLAAGAYDSVPGSITGAWTSSTTLSNGMCQVYNGSLRYPTTNFSSGYLPTGNPDYSSFSGDQVYYRAFYHAATPHSSGSLELAGLVNADVDPVGSGDVNVEIKLPTQTGWLDLGTSYDSGTFSGSDGDGCRVSQSGDDWAWTAGTFTTADSGYMYILRITIKNSAKSITQIRELGTGWA